jgi:hypothetical protein
LARSASVASRSILALAEKRSTCGSMMALASPCGVWYLPPSWWAIACTLPTLARVKAMPA